MAVQAQMVQMAHQAHLVCQVSEESQAHLACALAQLVQAVCLVLLDLQELRVFLELVRVNLARQARLDLPDHLGQDSVPVVINTPLQARHPR